MLMAYSGFSFLLAFGLHLNILCVIAQLLLIRQDLMDTPSYVSHHFTYFLLFMPNMRRYSVNE